MRPLSLSKLVPTVGRVDGRVAAETGCGRYTWRMNATMNRWGASGSIAIAMILAGCHGSGAEHDGATPSASGEASAPWYEREIRAYEDADSKGMPPPGGVLFVGSSSIRMWDTLAEDMSPAPVINRGFGGSKTDEVLAVFERVVAPYEPGVIVYYCGDNDLGTTNTDAWGAADGFIEFDRRARALWPEIEVIYIPIKASLARWSNWEAMELANSIVRAYCDSTPGATYADTVTPTLAADGTPDPAMFLGDGLHLSAAGYEAWTGVVRPLVLEAWRDGAGRARD